MSHPIRYIDVIPNSDTARANSPFNVLGGLINDAKETITLPVTLWGKAEADWQPIVTQNVEIQPGEHKHIYYTIPRESMRPAFWHTDELEELELLTHHNPPAGNAKGILIFVEP